MVVTRAWWLLCLAFVLGHVAVDVESFSVPPAADGNSHDSLSFSLEKYQKECALEASRSLDASRLHFQILFVDDDNAKGRIAEGLLAKIAEYNDAMFVLFPASATISSSPNAPRDAAASSTVLAICKSLGLDQTNSETMGTDFDLSYLDEYDLIVAMDEDIRSLILRSLPSSEDQEYYRPRCRLMSEFLSPGFVTNSMTHENCAKASDDDTTNDGAERKKRRVQWDMLDTTYQDRVAPWVDQVLDRSSNLFTTTRNNLVSDWPVVESGLILASGGITRFCLSTIEAQFEAALESLLETNLYKKEHLEKHWDEVDSQLRRCNSVVTGYFSPGQRKTRFERHWAKLQATLSDSSG